MKVLIVNGSPHADGNTALALREAQQVLQQQGIDTEMLHVGHLPLRGCLACRKCRETGRCVMDDIVNEAAQRLAEADGLLVGSPVYFASPAGTLISFLDRLFYSSSCDMTMKVGAAVAVARRGGCTAAFDVMNKYFAINGMPIAPSQYWNILHGNSAGEASQDEEGMQTMRTLARNMAFMIKSLALGRQQFGLPDREERKATNFIR